MQPWLPVQHASAACWFLHPSCPPWPTLQVQLSLAAAKLENKDTFGKSDPFLRISKARENGEWTPVLKTEVGGGCWWLVGATSMQLLFLAAYNVHAFPPGHQQQPEPRLAPLQSLHGPAVQL